MRIKADLLSEQHVEMLATNIDKQRVALKEPNRTTFMKVPEEHTVD